MKLALQIIVPIVTVIGLCLFADWLEEDAWGSYLVFFVGTLVALSSFLASVYGLLMFFSWLY